MEDFFQFSVFDTTKQPFKIDKPIRLIELFAGIGSQAKALERLGVDFEHYRICEFDKYAVASYNAVHGTNFETSDITKITAKDLGIVDTYKYLYMMTYSFPCQDLSLAGKQKGMAKGDDTRSGLLWEVERLLNECTELPQVLLMENVTQVHGKKNKEHFDEWIKFLESKGYSNFWQDLNAKGFGIPQNRNRTFMVSILGDYTYEFPKEFPLELRLKDMLEDSVDEKFYLSDRAIQGIKNSTYERKQHIVQKKNWCDTLLSRDYKDPKCVEVGMLSGGKWDKMHDVSRRVYSGEGISPTIHTCGGGNTEPKVIGGIGEKKSNGGTQWYQQDRIYDNNVAISVTTGFNPYYKVEEPQINVVGNYSPSGHDASRIVDAGGLAPTVKENHGTITAAAEPMVWDGYNQRIRAEKGIVGTLTRNCGADLKRNGQGIIEPLAYDEQNGYIRKDGTVGTLTTDGSSPKHNNRVVEPVRLGYIPYPNSDKPHQSNTFYDENAISPTLDTCIGVNRQVKVLKNNLRIRKLTPKECWRLMGFDDADFEKAAKYNSNSQLYKQAGNSIVVDVLYYIFKQMFAESEAQNGTR